MSRQVEIYTRTPEQVSEHLRAILHTMRKKLKEVQIIVSEITPRNDNKDDDVIRCNELINSMCADKDYITIVQHSNLRNDNWSLHEDAKHISKAAIPRLVSNVKRALRKAFGVTSDGSKPRGSNSRGMPYKRPLESRLQEFAGYNAPSIQKKPSTTDITGNFADPNILLMQLAQLLRLVTPT